MDCFCLFLSQREESYMYLWENLYELPSYPKNIYQAVIAVFISALDWQN